ncbi:anti-Muellerian hormone type-2 receptor isoform X2 [Paroedura picta]|uniref:anti-Muellerian hormone type-2 receptor isoform X2 n=1 Tax=Paroedura picta TaxID=143630 RepID=UPI004056F1CE
MGSYGLLWRATFWLLVQGPQSMWTGARAENRSCISYESGALTEGVEHLQGLILEDGRNGTIQCPHNQCCFGIWKVIQGQLQAQLKGCWISEKEATCDSPVCESRSSEDTLKLSCKCRADLCNANISHDGKRHADSLPNSTGTIWIISACPVLFLLGFLAFLVLRLWKGPALSMRPQETGELTKVTTGSERYSERKLPKKELLDLQFHKVLHEGQCSKGSLRHFLIRHVCSWDVAIRLGSSLAKGLAFLHGQQWKEGLHKPGVAHRDLSSQNVLVQEDMTCVISDFGLAMTLPTSHERWRVGRAESVVRKAGAPRYTAPEILDESLNLQDLGSALRQADVYSMALVLWETLMRCSILFPESSTPEFQLAYEAELGSNPTYSELRRLAVEDRGRPAIPLAWRRMGQASVYLQELLEDCWDPEPEARLQPECAQRRLQRLGAADVVKEWC